MAVTHRLGEATVDVVSELVDEMVRHRRKWMLRRSLLFPELWWVLLCCDTMVESCSRCCRLYCFIALSLSLSVYIAVVAVVHKGLLGGISIHIRGLVWLLSDLYLYEEAGYGEFDVGERRG